MQQTKFAHDQSESAMEEAGARWLQINEEKIATFKGEPIERNVPPGTHVVHPGETLEFIASQHLGAEASRHDVHRHVAEIKDLHNIENDEELAEGQKLILPGHTSDGGTILQDAQGVKYTRWIDGVERVEGTNGGYVRRYDSLGGYCEQHWGPHPDDNYELVRNGEGQYRIDGRVVDSSDCRVSRGICNNSSEGQGQTEAAVAFEVISDLRVNAASVEAFVANLNWLMQRHACSATSSNEFAEQMANLLNNSRSEIFREGMPQAQSAYHDIEIRFGRVFGSLSLEEKTMLARKLSSEASTSLLLTLEELVREARAITV